MKSIDFSDWEATADLRDRKLLVRPIGNTNTWGRVNTNPDMSYLEYQMDDGNFAMHYYEPSRGMYVCPWATNTFEKCYNNRLGIRWAYSWQPSCKNI